MFLLAGTALGLVACAPTIKRSGYRLAPGAAWECSLVFIRDTVIADKEPLGTVLVQGAASDCSESRVLALVRKEGCFLGANTAVMGSETRGSFWHPCFETQGAFYRLDHAVPQDSAYFSQSALAAREAEDAKTGTKTTRTRILLAAAAVFALGGMLAYYASEPASPY